MIQERISHPGPPWAAQVRGQPRPSPFPGAPCSLVTRDAHPPPQDVSSGAELGGFEREEAAKTACVHLRESFRRPSHGTEVWEVTATWCPLISLGRQNPLLVPQFLLMGLACCRPNSGGQRAEPTHLSQDHSRTHTLLFTLTHPGRIHALPHSHRYKQTW